MQGPELRVGVLAEPMTLNEGEVLELGGKGIPLPDIAIPALLPGQEVLLDDGKLLLRVTEQTESGAVAEVLRGGVLRGRKSLALPGAHAIAVMLPAEWGEIQKPDKYGIVFDFTKSDQSRSAPFSCCRDDFCQLL